MLLKSPNIINSTATLRPKLLVVDDDEAIVKEMQAGLSDEYSVFPAGDRATALDIFTKEHISLAVLDLGASLRPEDAVESLRTMEDLIGKDPLAKIIVLCGTAQRRNALKALEKGAIDVFPKPVDLDELKTVLQRACLRVEMEKEQLQEASVPQSSFESMIGSSPAMQAIYSTIRKVAVTDLPVLILGESGTGKDLVARAIYNLSALNHRPFVAVNCGSIPENLLERELFGNEKGAFTRTTAPRRGKLEDANGGTLFLDEIGDLPQPLQVRLLRLLQEKVIERVGGREPIPVQCRVISATHRDLDAAVKSDRFRDDLYFRLAVVKIPLPPLRQRAGDVVELADHLIESFSRELKRPPRKLSESALAALHKHYWPGNVRELQNRIKCALVLAKAPFISAADLELEVEPPPASASRSDFTLREARSELDRGIIKMRLRENTGNISKTARALGISRPTLYELIDRYGLA